MSESISISIDDATFARLERIAIEYGASMHTLASAIVAERILVLDKTISNERGRLVENRQ